MYFVSICFVLLPQVLQLVRRQPLTQTVRLFLFSYLKKIIFSIQEKFLKKNFLAKLFY